MHWMKVAAVSACIFVSPAALRAATVKILKGRPVPLERLGGVDVLVQGAAGMPVEGVVVSLATSFSSRPLVATTAPSGKARFRSIAPETYHLLFEPPNGSAYALEPVEAGVSSGSVQVKSGQIARVVSQLTVAGSIVVKTLRNDGTAWKALDPGTSWLSFSVADGTTGRHRALAFRRPWQNDVEGSAVLSALPPATGVQAYIRVRGYRDVRVDCPDIRSKEVATLSVTVDPDDPTGVEGIVEPTMDIVVENIDDPLIGGETTSDSSGYFSMAGLPPGRYRIRSLGGPSLEVEVHSGQRTRASSRATGAAPVRMATAATADDPPMPGLTLCEGLPLPWTDPYYEPTKAALRQAIDAVKQCLPDKSGCRDRVLDYLRQRPEVRVHCARPVDTDPDRILCGATWNKVIWLYDSPLLLHPSPFNPKNTAPDVCGCVAGTLFHELVHHTKNGTDECDTCLCARHCVPCAGECLGVGTTTLQGTRYTDCPATGAGQHPCCAQCQP